MTISSLPPAHTPSTMPASAPPPESNPRISFILGSRPPKLEFVKRQYMQLVLDHCNGNQTKAAKMLGISRESLYRALRSKKE
jgi:DNA-binding NtrC family response regulator